MFSWWFVTCCNRLVFFTWLLEQLLWCTTDTCRPGCDTTAPLVLTAHSSTRMRTSARCCLLPRLLVNLSLLLLGRALRAGTSCLNTASTLSSGQGFTSKLRKNLLPFTLESRVPVQEPRGCSSTEPFTWAFVKKIIWYCYWKWRQTE